MKGEQIEEAAAYVLTLIDAGTEHKEMFRLCAEKFPEMLKRDFVLACQIAMHDAAEEDIH